MKSFIVRDEHKAPKYQKNILESSVFKSFAKEFNYSTNKLSLKLNSDIEMLEYLYE
jgi:hypothetical protein